jgi:hypothetical protein
LTSSRNRTEEYIPCFIAIFNVDRILIWWSTLDHASGYVRYRDPMEWSPEAALEELLTDA